MFKFKPVSPWMGGLIAAMTGLVAVMSASADGQETLAVDRSGDAAARAVVLIPGLATDGSVWDGTLAALGAQMDAHVVTLAGFGDQPPAARGEAGIIGTAAADIVALLESEDLHDTVLVGHSMGAQIALQVAAAAPGRVGDVVIVDSAPFFARLFNPSITPEQAAGFGQGMAAAMAGMERDAYLAQSRQGLVIQSITPQGQAQVMAWLEASDQATVAAAFGEVAGTDFSPVLPQVGADVTVLVAWAPGAPVDAETLAGLYRTQYADLATVQVEVIEGARHFIMLDRPDAFAARLAEVVANGEGQ